MFKKLLTFLAMMATAVAFAAVDVNKATPADLDSIKGIGPSTAEKIIKERKNGDFKDWADFEKRVPGVKDKRAAKLSAAGLTVGGASYAGAPAAEPKASSKKAADKAAAATAAAPVAPAAATAPAAAAPATAAPAMPAAPVAAAASAAKK